MFSEDNIVRYCGSCKKCDEVKKCPLRAEIGQQQRKDFFIPLSAANGKRSKKTALFAHIPHSTVTILDLKDHHGRLNGSIFNRYKKS